MQAICNVGCVYIWSEEELDPVDGSFQSQPSDEEDSEHQVGQGGGDVYSLIKAKDEEKNCKPTMHIQTDKIHSSKKRKGFQTFPEVSMPRMQQT